MTYDHTLQMIVPVALVDLARSINRALDYDDVGGADAFQRRVSKGGAEFFSYSRPCDADYAQRAAMLFMVPGELHAAVRWDYETRWPDLPVPTLADCGRFCASAECFVDAPAKGYEPVVPAFIETPNQGENNNGNS